MNLMRWAAALAVVLTTCRLSVVAAAEPETKPLRVAMYSGSAEYQSAESLSDLKRQLEEAYGASCSLHIADEKGTTLAGIADLETCDVAVIFTRRLKLDEGQVAKLKKYCDAGRPIVGIRTASHAFQTWLEFDRLVLGGNYSGHYREDRSAAVRRAVEEHPVLSGVKEFTTTGKMYKNPGIAADVTRLLTASSAEATEPVAWVRQHRGGRIFYTSLGTREDFRNPDFRRLIINAIFWTAGREAPLPAR